MIEPVSFGVVSFTVDDGLDQPANVPGVHLPVAIDFHDYIGIVFQSDAVAGNHGGPDTKIGLMCLNNETFSVRKIFAYHFTAAFRAGVINTDNQIHFVVYFRNDIDDLSRNPIARYYHGDHRHNPLLIRKIFANSLIHPD